MALEISRWFMRLQVGDKVVKIGTEMLIPTPGLSDYLLIASTVKTWEPPFDNLNIDETTKQTILQMAQAELVKIGRFPEVV